MSPLTWVDILDAEGRVVDRDLREVGSLAGTLRGGIAPLAHELGVSDPHALRAAISAGVVAATFRGGGTYEIGASEVERVKADGLVRARDEEPDGWQMYPTRGGD